MKKGMITMMALMLGMSGMMAQGTLVVAGSGDVTITQGETFEAKCDGKPEIISNDGKIVLTSHKDYDLTLPSLQALRMTGSGDVESKGILNYPNLDILISGVGDANLTVESDTILATLTGIGDLILNGHCSFLQATVTGLGELDLKGLNADSVSITNPRGGHHTLEGNWEKENGLIYNPNWSGFEAGLNMLLGPGPNTDFVGEYALLDQRTMKSWNFNFNITDIGLAFTPSHRAGIFTGIGLGWNNYRFNNPVRLEKGADRLVCTTIDESVEGHVKKSKLGVLYLQAPLMLEFRPSRHSYIDLGVTGGIRIDAWTKVKYYDGVRIKIHDDYYINRFKLDASLRAGGENLGFYANFNLLPLFAKGKAQDAHCLSLGLSLVF